MPNTQPNPTRDYSCKDAELLIAGESILAAAIDNKAALQKKRANWTDQYFADLKDRIDHASKTYLGVDSAKALRENTKKLMTLISPVQESLAELKVQIKEDFKDEPSRRDEILRTLGYTDYDRSQKRGDQEALIALLARFAQNMSPSLIDEIVAKGTSKDTIEAILASGDDIRKADVAQEFSKGERPESTAVRVAELNAIYQQIISICKLSTAFLKGNKAAQDLFSFNKVVGNINGQPRKKKATTSAAPAAAA